MRCKKCDNEVSNDFSFCPNCGTKIIISVEDKIEIMMNKIKEIEEKISAFSSVGASTSTVFVKRFVKRKKTGRDIVTRNFDKMISFLKQNENKVFSIGGVIEKVTGKDLRQINTMSTLLRK